MENTAMAWIYFSIGAAAAVLVVLSFIIGEVTDFLHDVASPVTDWMGDHLSFSHDDGSTEFSRFLNGGTMLGFIAGFGFVAALSMAAWGASSLAAAGWGIGGGLGLSVILGLIYVGLQKSQATSSYDENDLVGKVCQVSERVYPNSAGQIVCVVNGTNVWHTARSVDGKEIEVGKIVKVERTSGGILYVTPEK